MPSRPGAGDGPRHNDGVGAVARRTTSTPASSPPVHANAANVVQQSGIEAGEGGFQINVGGNTNLIGGLLTSNQAAVDANRNALTTGTLTTRDIQNVSDGSASSTGLGASFNTGATLGQTLHDDPKNPSYADPGNNNYLAANGGKYGLGRAVDQQLSAMPAITEPTIMRTLRGIALGVLFVLLSGCGLMKPTPHQGPWARDMFSIYDGAPSTPEQREAATSDCLGYASSTSIRSQTPVILWYQICMLQLGFRAPQGELLGVAADPISGGGCMYTPYHPVCYAEKGGWPQDPPPRWSRPDTSRWTLEGDVSICLERTPSLPYQDFTPYMDKCMIAKGYTVAHPSSPSMVWPAKSTWPNCAKPESQRNWIGKKWCPPAAASAHDASAPNR